MKNARCLFGVMSFISDAIRKLVSPAFKSDLRAGGGCCVYFLHIAPVDAKEKKRWSMNIIDDHFN